MILVADIGGTNCRFALGRSGAVLPATLTRLRIADFADFDAALGSFLAAQGNPPLAAACLAVAGPVTDGRARLTNGGWALDRAALSASLDAPVTRLNDLAALGHALPPLAPAASRVLHRPGQQYPNGQSAVLGLGTGANLAAVLRRPDGPPAILSAEAGYQTLPRAVADRLAARLGPDLAAFPSTEHLFSGPGLARLHAALHGPRLSPEALTRPAPPPQAAETLGLFAELLGLWLQELALATLPRDGLWLAGSTARGLVDAGFGPTTVRAFTRPHANGGPTAAIPLHLITDDGAALTGCSASSRSRMRPRAVSILLMKIACGTP